MSSSRDLACHPAARAAAKAPRLYGDRLPFRLPPFLRMAWATAAARDRWSGPLNRLVDAVRAAEWLSVAAGVRPAALIIVPQAQAASLAHEWSSRGLASRIASPNDQAQIRALHGKTPKPGPADAVHLVTRRERLAQLDAVWRSADLVELACWLGYPSCCAGFLKAAVVEQQCLDTIWPMIEGDPQQDKGVSIAEIAGAAVNPLLSALGLRATPHRPCSFHCEATQSLAAAYGELSREAAAPPEPNALKEVLDWPMEWSSLHGIIEVRLPVLKLCYDGDATAAAYKVRLTGGALPEHAALGLEFPNRQPERRRAPIAAG